MSKRYWLLVLACVGLAVVISSLVASDFLGDRPDYSLDEVTSLVRIYLQSFKSYPSSATFQFTGEYAGKGKWSGTCDISWSLASLPRQQTLRWEFYEKTKQLETIEVSP